MLLSAAIHHSRTLSSLPSRGGGLLTAFLSCLGRCRGVCSCRQRHSSGTPSLAAAPLWRRRLPSAAECCSSDRYISFPLPSPFPTFSLWSYPTAAVLWRSVIRHGDVGTGGKGDVGGSLAQFDRAIELDPRQKSYLWQRGLSLYYLNRFEEGAEQFRTDVAENPNDTEESIWCFLCEAQLYGAEEARGRFLQVGRDPRPFMLEAYNMFKDGGDPEKLVSMFSDGQGNELFYASLYAGLYYESQNDADSSKRHILAACASEYGVSSGDYMASLARVHCLCRNWMPGK